MNAELQLLAVLAVVSHVRKAAARITSCFCPMSGATPKETLAALVELITCCAAT